MAARHCLPWILALFPALAWGALCPPDHLGDRGRVAYVYDGDTLRLEDGRHIRFVGINAPEIAHDEKPAEPFGQAARAALKGLLPPGTEVGLRYDEGRRDRYHRTLAHVYLHGDTSVEALLLEKGLASVIVIPPNEWQLGCYQAAERRARDAGRGIWGPGFGPMATTRLDHDTRGYHLIKGRVVHIGDSRRSVWLDLEGHVALRIDRKDLRYFKHLDLHALRGREVMARGWVYAYHGELQIRIRHPAMIEVQP